MQLTLSKRLACGVGGLVAIVAGLGVVSLFSLSRVGASVDDLAKDWLPSVEAAARAQDAMGALRRIELLHVLADSDAEIAGFDKEYADQKDAALAKLRAYGPMVTSEEERTAYGQTSEAADAYLKISGRVIDLSRAKKKDEALTLTRHDGRAAFKALQKDTDELVAVNERGAQRSSEQAETTSGRARLAVMVFSATGVMIGAAAGMLLSRSIRRPIARVVASLEAVAGHDLTKPDLKMTVQDEIGRLARATDSMSGSLRSIVGQVASTSTGVAAASTEVAASSEELATTVRNQEQTTGQVASAVSELSSSVSEVATKAADANNAAKESKRQADAGGKLVERTVQQLGAINDRFNEMAKVVSSLEKQGGEVGRVVQVIRDIADQTNLLALNAAIEAARAGEHGRGFAVVADEVRKLAERTSRATGEVSDTIGAMREETEKAAAAMKVGRETVEEGRTLGSKAGEAVSSIVEAQMGAEAMAAAIAAAAQEQASATEEIARSLEQMSAANAESASAASQSSTAATDLSKQAEELNRLVGKFKR